MFPYNTTRDVKPATWDPALFQDMWDPRDFTDLLTQEIILHSMNRVYNFDENNESRDQESETDDNLQQSKNMLLKHICRQNQKKKNTYTVEIQCKRNKEGVNFEKILQKGIST